MNAFVLIAWLNIAGGLIAALSGALGLFEHYGFFSQDPQDKDLS